MSMVATVIVLWLPKDYTHRTNASSKSVNGVRRKTPKICGFLN